MGDKKEINHWCVLCGTGYHACDTCNKEKTFTPWRALTDTIEHYKIFMILKEYNNNLINREQAKEALSNLDLSGKENYKESAKQVLEDIYADVAMESMPVETLIKKKTRKSIKTNIENENISEENLFSEEDGLNNYE